MRTLKIIFLISALIAGSFAQTHNYITESGGTLSFPKDGSGYRVPDFSYVGYQYGADLPTYGVEYGYTAAGDLTGDLATGSSIAVSEANKLAIQNHIDAVEALTPNAYGYRGTVYIPAGTWFVRDHDYSLNVQQSGIVIRGAGEGVTVLQEYAHDNSPQMFIQLGLEGSQDTAVKGNYYDEGQTGTNWNIETAVVDIGDMSFDVATGHGLAVDDEIIIYHPCTQAWLDAIEGGVGDQWDSTDHPEGNNPDPWEVGDVPIRYWRTVTAVDGDTITIDAPLFYPLVKSIAQCTVYKYTEPFLQELGIENITLDAYQYGSDEASTSPSGYFRGVEFRNVKHGWARNVTVRNFRREGIFQRFSRQISWKEVNSINPHAPIEDSERYNFSADGGQNVLYEDCYGNRGRHTFVTNGWASDSGFVMLRCSAVDPYDKSESGHQRWATGFLWDQFYTDIENAAEPGTTLSNRVFWAGNHGDNGNHPQNNDAHGMTGGATVVWRSTFRSAANGGEAILQVLPTVPSWEFLSTGGLTSAHPNWGDYPGANGTGLNAAYSGTMPTSLYETQYAQRIAGAPAGGGSITATSASSTTVNVGP